MYFYFTCFKNIQARIWFMCCLFYFLNKSASHYSKSKTTKSIIHTGLNSYAEYSNEVTNRFVATKKNELGIGIGTADPYSSKIFSNSSNNLNSYGSNGKSQASSSFFKRSMITNNTSTTITGKSSTPKRNVGIKVNVFYKTLKTYYIY